MPHSETFGHFLLPLTLNKGDINAKLAERIFAVRTHYLELKKTRPERHAIRNLLGMLAFRLNQFEEALKYLEKVLTEDEDPDNLNALANRKYISEKLFMFPEARDCEQRLTKLLAEDGSEDCTKRLKRLRARSLAEQAFAYSFEPFGESVTFDRYDKSVALYQQAIELAGDVIGQDEMEDWLFSSGMASYTIYRRIRWGKLRTDDPKTRFQLAVDRFIKIVQISKDACLLSDSWRHLGELFERPHEHLPSIPDNYQIYVRHPEKCFQKALAASPNNPRIIARYADHCKGASNLKALDLLNQSIQKDSSRLNIRAYYIRARIFIDQYKQSKEWPLLEKAEEDLKTIQKYSFTPWHLESMAEVFYFKAKHQGLLNKAGDVQANLQKALIFCAKAVSCQDGQKRPDVHKLRGKCLCDLGEHGMALGCFKRAVECESAAYLYRGSGDLLVREYEHILRATSTLLLSDSLFADMVYWLHQAAELCLFTKTTLRSLSKIQELPQHWIRFVMYCHDNKHDQKYESIKLAATDRSKSRHQSERRRMSCHALGEQLNLPLLHRRRSLPGTDYSPAPCDYIPDKPDQDNRGPTPVAHHDGRETQVGYAEIESPSNLCSHTDMAKESCSVVSEKASQSTAEPGDDEKSSDIIIISYSVNRRTGTMEPNEKSPSPSKITDGDSVKNVKTAPERPLNRNLPYDFLVIYSDSAEEWVLYNLLDELEGTGLKGCVEARDFVLGEYKLNNYSDSIENSVCVLIVITKDFEEDETNVRGMHMALVQPKKTVIPIILEVREVPPPLKGLTSFNATRVADWARLQRNIEEKITEFDAEVNDPTKV